MPEGQHIENQEGIERGKRIILDKSRETIIGKSTKYNSAVLLQPGTSSRYDIVVARQPGLDQALRFAAYTDTSVYALGDQVTVGRKNSEFENTIALPPEDLEISRKHLNIGTDLQITDSSKNGTVVRELRNITPQEYFRLLHGESFLAKLDEKPTSVMIGNTLFDLSVAPDGVVIGNKPLTERADIPTTLTFNAGTRQLQDITGKDVLPTQIQIILKGDVIEVRNIKATGNITIVGEDVKQQILAESSMKSPQTESVDKESTAEELAREIFLRGAGYMSGSLYNIRGIRHGIDNNRDQREYYGYSEGFPFVKGTVYTYPTISERNAVNERIGRVLGPLQGYFPAKFGNEFDEHKSHFWIRQPHAVGTVRIDTGKDRVLREKGWFREAVKEPIYVEVPDEINGFTPGEDWVRYTYAAKQEDDGRGGRIFHARLIVPPELAKKIDQATIDPELSLKIIQHVFAGKIGEDPTTQVKLIKPEQIVMVDSSQKGSIVGALYNEGGTINVKPLNKK